MSRTNDIGRFDAQSLIDAELMQDWSQQGVSTTRFEQANAGFPFLVREDRTNGRHWLHSRKEIQIPSGAIIQFMISLRPVGVPALRLRVDIGGKLVKNGHVDLSGGEDHNSGEMENLAVSRAAHGSTNIKVACRSPVQAEHVIFGLMFDSGNRSYDYPGTAAGLIIESVSVQIIDLVKPKADSSVHSRYSPFGRTAHKLCRGKGLEIGALHRPFDLDAQVAYLDYEKTARLKESYRNDPRVGDIRQVQLVWKGTSYPFFDDNAFDFVINSHVLEHVANPGRVIEEWLRIIRPGGVLYMVVPDKNFTFDRPRELTTIEHLLADFDSRIDKIPIEHYEDYIKNREGGVRDDAEKLIQNSFDKQTSIHVHTFTAASLRVFLDALQSRLGFAVEHYEPQGMHIHVALRRNLSS